MAERFIRTLKEQLLWVCTFQTFEDLRRAIYDWLRLYYEQWLTEPAWVPLTEPGASRLVGHADGRVTMSRIEAGRSIMACFPKDDAHCWLRSDDRRPTKPLGRVYYGYNGVQEIVGGT